jgi:hypothetical protein
MNTKCYKVYESPAILREVALAPKKALLDGSVVDTMNITATGQEVPEDVDFSGSGFNHDWQ